MTEIADQIRSIKLNHHIEFMLLGDPVKLLLAPLWGEQTDLPDVYQNVFQSKETKLRCNIWNLADNADSTCRMFPLDGTINTGFDYCIVVYDAITRIKAEQLDKWTTIKDQISSRQHKDRPCQLVVLIIKAPRTPVSRYQHIMDTCKKHGVYVIPVDNNPDGMDKIKSLPKSLANLVYADRKAKHHERIKTLLSNKNEAYDHL